MWLTQGEVVAFGQGVDAKSAAWAHVLSGGDASPQQVRSLEQVNVYGSADL